ncbi:MAG TPA: hypothetical protein VFE13_18775 [Caulobacteraceae bacterium]|jgi:hypothetical protein|nr:hypothetical protein [Caulobacteraceae bacterium]
MQKAILTTLAAAASLATALPALAQSYEGPPPGADRPAYERPAYERPAYDQPGYERPAYEQAPNGMHARGAARLHHRIKMLSQRLREEKARGAIDPRTAQMVRRELRAARQQIRMARDEGGRLSGQQRMQLRQSLNRVEAQLRS